MTKEKDFFDIIGIQPDKKNQNFDIITKEELDRIKQSDAQIEADFDEDFIKVKENLEYITNTIKNHILDLAVIARDKESAKEYDAITNMLRTLNDVSTNMIVMQEKRKKFKEKKIPLNTTSKVENNTNNIIFSGTTTDLKNNLNKLIDQIDLD
jgi:hypothetical protein